MTLLYIIQSKFLYGCPFVYPFKDITEIKEEIVTDQKKPMKSVYKQREDLIEDIHET